MDLSTKYLNLDLPHPFIPGASPLADQLDSIKRLEDSGAAAIVLRSLFEEQILAESQAAASNIDDHVESFGEALSYLPDPKNFRLGADDYLEHIRRTKEATSLPLIASLNGSTRGGWLRYANLMEEAGADALELNTYLIATDPNLPGDALERETVEMVRAVKERTKIPVAVKLSPYYSSLPHFARQLDEVNVDGIILFNRFYQPDIDIEELDVVRTLHLSRSSELLPRLHALALIAGRIRPSLAATGGIHTSEDAIKALMCGAHALQLVSALLLQGPNHIRTLIEEVTHWLEEHEYESLRQMVGSMSLLKCPDPRALGRLNYMELLQSWRG